MDQKASPPNLKDKIGADTAGSGATEQLREIAHELRNPLNALLAVSEVFRDERFGKLSNDLYRRYAELSHEATVRML